jgi:hypothetical protein
MIAPDGRGGKGLAGAPDTPKFHEIRPSIAGVRHF